MLSLAGSLLRLSCFTWLHLIFTVLYQLCRTFGLPNARVPKTRAAEGQHQGQTPTLTSVQTHLLLFATGVGFFLKTFPFTCPPLTCLLQMDTTPPPAGLGFCVWRPDFKCSERPWALSAMHGLSAVAKQLQSSVIVAGILVCLESSVMFDFCSLTGIQIAANWLQDILFCWRFLLCQGSILSLLGAWNTVRAISLV